MKLVTPVNGRFIRVSLPSRERGLKHHITGDEVFRLRVAPLAGAWIETLASPVVRPGDIVAPLAGAWIETHARFKR